MSKDTSKDCMHNGSYDTDCPIPFECYRLTLDHFMNVDGKQVRLEEPIVVQMTYCREFCPQSICLNDMLDKMRFELDRKLLYSRGGT